MDNADHVITREKFDEELASLRLSISEVSKATSIPRSYLSEFRSGDRQLRLDHLGKLKHYLETQGSTFTEEKERASNVEDIQRTALVIRHLAIDPALEDAEVAAILEKIAANDRQAEKIFQFKAEEGLFTGWNEATDYALRDIFGLFAANYALLRHLQGRSLVVRPNPEGQIDSISDLFANLFHQDNADVIGKTATPEKPETELEEEQS